MTVTTTAALAQAASIGDRPVSRVIRYKIDAVEPGEIRPRHRAWCQANGASGVTMPHSGATTERLPAMNDPLIEMLSCVTDARRPQAKRYVLANILLFCIFGFLCGAKSYQALCSFIEEHFALLQAAFPSMMKRAPAPSTLWRIIGLVDGGTLEAVFPGMLYP